jgi:hypothetical protein
MRHTCRRQYRGDSLVVVVSEGKMIKKLAGTVVAAGMLLTFGAPAAQAAPPEPFTIIETINFEAG